MKRILFGSLFAVSVVLSMPQATGTIAGRVLHADGTPAIGFRVVAGQEAVAPLWLRDFPIRGYTDFDGRFRFEGIAPNNYFVITGSDNYLMGTGSGFAITRPTYFPGVTDRGGAAGVGVTASAISEVELRLPAPTVPPPQPSFKIKGVVQGDLSRFRTNSEGYFGVGLFRAPGAVASSPLPTRVSIAPAGQFELRDVPPGKYTLIVSFWESDGGRGVASRDIEITDRDIVDFNLEPPRALPR